MKTISFRRRSSSTIGVLLILGMAATSLTPSDAAASATVVAGGRNQNTQPNCLPGKGFRCGYITVPSRGESPEAELSYNLRLPIVDGKEVEGRFPTLLVYQGYALSYRSLKPRYQLADEGYAVMMLNPRGTVCSSDVWRPFQPQEAYDAKFVIDEWIPQQEWSNEDVAMMGDSFGGITPIPVAALQPENLVAVVAAHTVGDFYRDVIRPGGIHNLGVTSFFTAAQAGFSAGETAAEIRDEAQIDSTECIEHIGERSPGYATSTPITHLGSHEFDGAEMQEMSTADNVEDIDVPVLLIGAWQDQVVGARAIDSLSGIRDLHAIFTNGDHWAVDAPGMGTEIASFLDHYVKGVANGYDLEDRIEVWWETGRSVKSEPGWITSSGQWPFPQSKTTELFLSGRGSLPGGGTLVDAEDEVVAGSDSYVYGGSSGQNNLQRGNGGGLPTGSWNAPARPGASLTYTTAALDEDLVALGSGSLDLWLASTAIDTDLQVTVSEIRDYGPDGGLQEVYVQQGWLRASHRALDESRSTEIRPFHSHQAAENLTPLNATHMRVEILPFAHVFRAGSRLRIAIEAPKSTPDLWYLDALKIPAVNTILHEPGHVSKLVLSTLPGQGDLVPRSYPACGAGLSQPCRPATM